MNYRTTAVLLAILAAFAAYMYLSGSDSGPSKTDEETNLQVLDLDASSIDSLEVREAGAVVLVRRNAEGKWEMVQPERAEGDEYRIEGAIFSVAMLNAQRLISTKADDLSTYGLDKPKLEVVIGSEGAPPTRLLIGSQNPGQSGSYVKRSDGDTVYLVDTYSTSQIRSLLDQPPTAKPTPIPPPVAGN